MNEGLKELVAQARKSSLIEDSDIDDVIDRHEKGVLSEREAIRLLKDLYRGMPLRLANLPTRQVGSEWMSLLSGMQEESNQWQSIARSQYRQGLYLLPISAIVVFGLTLAGNHWMNFPDTALVALAAAALATLAAQSFLIFRIHQQARFAAERLSEKRAAVLFIQAALARATPEQAPDILAAAAAMFLGHYAPSTIPLQPGELQKSGESTK